MTMKIIRDLSFGYVPCCYGITCLIFFWHRFEIYLMSQARHPLYDSTTCSLSLSLGYTIMTPPCFLSNAPKIPSVAPSLWTGDVEPCLTNPLCFPTKVFTTVTVLVEPHLIIFTLHLMDEQSMNLALHSFFSFLLDQNISSEASVFSQLNNMAIYYHGSTAVSILQSDQFFFLVLREINRV